MPSPFPGMDPYLEGYLWPDVHNGLAFVIKEQIAPRLGPGYVIHTNTYTVTDTSPEEDVGIMYPDVEVLRKKKAEEPTQKYASSEDVPLSPPTITIPAVTAVEVRIPEIEIRDRKNNRLITAIEILSPVNKRKPGLEPYREKRQLLHKSGTHLLEIDLLRRGTRPFKHPYLPGSDYLVTLLRAESGKTDVWAFGVRDKAPVLPVPLKQPDKDTFLDLGEAIDVLYDRSLYYKSIDYRELPPPPALSKEDMEWMRDRLPG